MRSVIAALTIFLFFAWLIPLGIFIKPSQEKMACDGQRAICLCSHSSAKAKGSPVAGYGLKKASDSNNKESGASGGAGYYVYAAHVSLSNQLTTPLLNDPTLLAYRNPFPKSVEHVPKV